MIGTQFNYYDQSTISETTTIDVQENIAPLTISCGPTEKGPEEPGVYYGDDWQKLFGAPNFKRYGQQSIQNQRIIDSKAKIFFKRLVADDATLAAAVLIANVKDSDDVQLTNAEGKPLYIKTTTVGEEPNQTVKEELVTEDKDPETSTPYPKATVKTCEISYEVQSLAEKATEKGVTIKTIDDAYDLVKEFYSVPESPAGNDGSVYSYPLFVITDNGRGISNKRFMIESENALSKNLDFMFYTLSIIEDGAITETVRFSIIPEKLYNNECVDIDSAAETYLKQAKIKSCPTYINEFIDRVQELAQGATDYEQEDILFGTKRKGTKIEGLTVNTEEGDDLSNILGMTIGIGDNGSFGDAPASNETAKKAINEMTRKFFAGETTLDVYNLDVYQIDACFDANFDIPTKQAIRALAEYRKDFFYFRDLGTDLATVDDIEAYKEDNDLEGSTWVADYCQAYDIIDPYTLKKEKVTIMYDLAAFVIDHIYSGRHLPLAGIRNNAIIESIDNRNSLNFAPKVLPTKNEKDEMEDIRVNFASYYQDNFVLETLYTSQDAYTQMSFINNVLAVQQVIKALRVHFPAERYQVITSSEDLKTIQASVNEFLDPYKSNFAELEYTYIEDKKYLQNKIYRAALNFRFNEFNQAELIDAYMLPSNIA